jgi:hypothetical protein
MATIIKLTYKKPSNTAWFSQTKTPVMINSTVAIPPAKAGIQFGAWSKSRDGYIGSITTLKSPDNISIFYVFDTDEHAMAWNEAKQSHPFYIAQQLYFENNNITIIEEML